MKVGRAVVPSGPIVRGSSHGHLLNLRAKTIFDKRALVVEHLAMTWNCIVEILREGLGEVRLAFSGCLSVAVTDARLIKQPIEVLQRHILYA
jgi:hypothetical protein